MGSLRTTRKREGQRWEMRARWILMGLLAMVIFSAAVTAEAPPTFQLVVTDGGTGVLGWVRAISVYPFDSAADKRAEDPIVNIDLPREPVKFEALPEGTYDITITVLRYGVNPILILLSRMQLTEDTVLDMRKIEIPYNLFIPS